MIFATRLTQVSLAFALLAGLSLSAPAQSQSSIRDEIHTVIQAIQSRIQAGKTNEADSSAELKKMDELAAQQVTASNTEAAAEITYTKAMLVSQFFDDFGQATNLIGKIKSLYPGTHPAEDADQIINEICHHAAAVKIQNSLASGMAFPDFFVTSFDGKKLATTDYKGKVLMIDFWATWCPPCRAEVPDIVNIYKKFHTQGYEIIGVSLDYDTNKLTSFIKNYDMPWPQFCDQNGWTNSLVTKYGIDAIPATILIGKDGKIIDKNLLGPDLESAIQKALQVK